MLKYSAASRFAGGLAHIGTLGVGLMVEKISGNFTWPGFTNSIEVCPVCKLSPGSKGCCEVQLPIKPNWMPGTKITSVNVDHSNKL